MFVDGVYAGLIAEAPYRVETEIGKAGRHTVLFEVLGNRFNTCGDLHSADTSREWCNPGAWWEKGDAWCYEYALRPFGLLKSPVLEIYT